MKKLIQKAFRFFKADQRGSLSIEAVIALPMLFWAATATFSFYDAYKMQNSIFRANYTIGDMLSRETEAVDQAYLEGLGKVFKYMTSNRGESSWIRVTVVKCKKKCKKTDKSLRTMKVVWSHSTGGARKLNNTDFAFYNTRIPLVARGDKLILVETSRQYAAPFNQALVGFMSRDMVAHSVTRPRFAPQLKWTNN